MTWLTWWMHSFWFLVKNQEVTHPWQMYFFPYNKWWGWSCISLWLKISKLDNWQFGMQILKIQWRHFSYLLIKSKKVLCHLKGQFNTKISKRNLSLGSIMIIFSSSMWNILQWLTGKMQWIQQLAISYKLLGLWYPEGQYWLRDNIGSVISLFRSSTIHHEKFS